MFLMGIKSLDSFFGGGFVFGVLIQVYGFYVSGKMILVLQIGLFSGKKVVYVDIEGGFFFERFVQMVEMRGLNFEEVFLRFILFIFLDFKEQRCVIGLLKKMVDSNFVLVVVDLIIVYYRVEENRSGLIVELSRQFQVFFWIVWKYNILVIVINQVYFDSRIEMIKFVVEQIFGYCCKDIFCFDKLLKLGLRVVVFERYCFRFEGFMVYFRIMERGIEDVE